MPSSDQPGSTAHAPEPSPDDRYVFVPQGATQNLVTKVALRRDAVGSVAIGTNTSPSEVLPPRDGDALRLVAKRRNDQDDPHRLVHGGGHAAAGRHAAGVAHPDPRGAHFDRQPALQPGAPGIRRQENDGTGQDAGSRRDRNVRQPGGGIDERRHVYATFDATAGGSSGWSRWTPSGRRSSIRSSMPRPGGRMAWPSCEASAGGARLATAIAPHPGVSTTSPHRRGRGVQESVAIGATRRPRNPCVFGGWTTRRTRGRCWRRTRVISNASGSMFRRSSWSSRLMCSAMELTLIYNAPCR